MRTAKLAFIVAAGAVLTASPSLGADLGGAKAFVAQIYAHYPQRHGAPPYEPTGRLASAVFDPSMVDLLREDARLTPKGDVGAIDGDPFCDCQDDAGLQVKVGAIGLTDPLHATARVDLRFTEERPPETRRVDLDLVDVHGHWRVYDVKTKDLPSLRALLVQSNRTALDAQRHHGRAGAGR